MKELAAQRIRHYALQQELSHKAGRRTFVARDLRDLYTKTPVIIKILQLGSAFEWDELKLFKREAQILQHLDYPAIPQYKESFEAEINGMHSFVLVQTYIPAPSLQKVVEAGKLFSEAEAIAIAQKLLKTLIYLHQQLPPIIHRDIKPSNILIGEPSGEVTGLAGSSRKEVYLVDFGAVQITASRGSGTVTIVGSYGYMPLEQFLGQTTPVSDLYSLGMTLLYLVTGLHPADLPQIDGRIRIERLGEIVELSGWFVHWLSQMTQPYADQRFESAVIALSTLNHRKDYKNDGSGYFPYLQPNSHKLHIYRQQNELKIVYQQPIVPNSWGCLLLILTVIICFLLGAFGVMVLVIGLGSLALNYPLGKGKQPKPALYSYRVISINHTLGIRMGRAKGHSLHSSSIRWTGTPSPFQSIHLLTYNPGYTFKRYYNKKKRTFVPSSISIPPKLSIYAGKHEYSIQCPALSAAEQRWLDRELNDFLELSLQKFDPTDADQTPGLRKTASRNHIEDDESFSRM